MPNIRRRLFLVRAMIVMGFVALAAALINKAWIIASAY